MIETLLTSACAGALLTLAWTALAAMRRRRAFARSVADPRELRCIRPLSNPGRT
jgi:hypothetical protein